MTTTIKLLTLTDAEALVNKLAAPWGGEWNGVSLVNTCTIDTILSALYMEYVQFPHFKKQLHTMARTDKVCQVLLDMFGIVTGSNHTWTAARLQWMRRVLKKDVRVGS